MSKQLKFTLFIGLALLSMGFAVNYTTTPYFFKSINYFPPMPVNDSNQVTNEGVELGRYLFYDSILSQNYTMSCATCHQQKFAFTDNKQFNKGINNTILDRNTMPLFNLAWYPSFFWDGRSNSIENQVFVPVSAHNEMNLSWSVAEKRIKNNAFYKPLFKKAFGNQKIDSILISKAIAQFERTLISSNSKFDKVLRGELYLSKDEYTGYGLLNNQTKGDCLHCHTTDGDGLGTILKFSNNGLDTDTSIKDKGLAKHTNNNNDIGKFKIPSLRNLLFTAPYMHDGRFETITDVLNFYSDGVKNNSHIDSKMTFAHQGGNKLSNIEKKQIKAFLLTLSDSVFITNPNYGNPFFNEH